MKDYTKIDKLIKNRPPLSIIPKTNPYLWIINQGFKLGAMSLLMIIPLSFYIYTQNLFAMTKYKKKIFYYG